MESLPLSPLSSPAEVTQTWLEKVLRQKLGSSLRINSWSMKLPETRIGFLSEICFIQTSYSISDGAEEKRSLVVKFMPNARQALLDDMKKCHLGVREVEFYKHAASGKFRVFCKNSGLHHPVPEVYWAELKDDKLTVVLPDLCNDGFRLSTPPEGNSLKQIKCVLATVAIIHGSGIATIKKRGKLPGDMPLDTCIFKDYIVIGINKQIKLFEGTPTVNTLKALLPRVSELLTVEEKYPLLNTLIHGDLWAANVMFSQDDSNACIIDWQYTRVGNIVCDIVTFLLLSGKACAFIEHLTEILECYWESFEQSLKKNGVTVDISFQGLVRNVESMWIYGYMFFSAALPDLMTSLLITEERIQSVIHFLAEKGIFKEFLC